MTETIVNTMNIFKKYGLEVEEAEPTVFKVLNTDKEISLDELQIELGDCITLTSDEIGYKRLDMGGCSSLTYVYYIITDCDREDLGSKYDAIAAKRFGKSIYRYFKYRPEYGNSIDTIYAKGEI